MYASRSLALRALRLTSSHSLLAVRLGRVQANPAACFVRIDGARCLNQTAFQHESSSVTRGNSKISYEELKPITESPTGKILLIDVREPSEVVQGNIPSSVNLPLSQLQEALDMEPPLFARKYSFNKPSRKQEIIFYCLAGVRSASALSEFHRKGYDNVRNYEGSWEDWKRRESQVSNSSDDD